MTELGGVEARHRLAGQKQKSKSVQCRIFSLNDPTDDDNGFIDTKIISGTNALCTTVGPQGRDDQNFPNSIPYETGLAE